MAGKGTPATALLARRTVAHQVHTYAHHDRAHHNRATHHDGAGYGEEAAALMGQDARRVFKTLVALVDGALTVGIVPVSAQLDLKALAAAAGGKKAVLAEVADAERATGYVAGGISPLGQRRRLPTVLDASAREHPTVFCSGGRRGLEIELAPGDLASLTGAVVARIATP